MWDLVPWAARWAEGQSKKSQKYLADDAHKNMWVPLPHIGSQEKAVFSREHLVPRTRAQAARASLLSLPRMRLLSPSIIFTIPAPSSLHLLMLLPSTPSHGRGQFKQTKEGDQTDGQRFPPRRKGHPKQGRESYRVRRNRRMSLPWVFWDWPVCRFEIVDYDGGSHCHPPRRRDKASSLDTPLSESISEAICCLLNGWGSTGAIDPKTFQKYMWPFIPSIADLETAVVSLQSFCFLWYLSNYTHLISSRLFLKAGKIVAVWTTASSV